MDAFIIPYFIKICTEQIGPGSNTSDLCMGNVLLKSQLRHWLS